jgi:N-acetylmuramoyl-L-alanine amidase
MSARGRQARKAATDIWRWRLRPIVVLLPLLLPAGLLVHTIVPPEGTTAGASPARIDDQPCQRAAFRIVVDVGHTEEAPGAISARGVTEYDFNLRLARQVEHKLTGAGFTSTVLLVTGGRAKSSLYDRVAKANALRANLFLSIHHDSVPSFFREEWEYEGQKIGFSDRFKGHSIFISQENARRSASLDFARLLGRELKQRDLHYTPHYAKAFMGHWQRQLVDANAGVYRYDQLHVLRTTHMPAVLLEAGSIVNRDEELVLATPERQAVIASAVAEAVQGYCASRAPKRPKPRIVALGRS